MELLEDVDLLNSHQQMHMWYALNTKWFQNVLLSEGYSITVIFLMDGKFGYKNQLAGMLLQQSTDLRIRAGKSAIRVTKLKERNKALGKHRVRRQFQ